MNSLTTNSQFVTDWKLNAEIRALKWECERQLRETEWKLNSQIRELESQVQRASRARSAWIEWFPLCLPVVLLWTMIILIIASDHASH